MGRRGRQDGAIREIVLRPFTDADIETLARWLSAPHVIRWYAPADDWLREVRDRNGEFRFLHHWIAECAGRPIGFCQYYRYADGGEVWHGSLSVDGAYSLDYLIGEADALGRGYGKSMLRALLARIRAIPGAKRVIVQPEAGNTISRKTLLACGFRHVAQEDVYVLEVSP